MDEEHQKKTFVLQENLIATQQSNEDLVKITQGLEKEVARSQHNTEQSLLQSPQGLEKVMEVMQAQSEDDELLTEQLSPVTSQIFIKEANKRVQV